MKKIRSALISVSDKSNLKPLLQTLKKNNVKLFLVPSGLALNEQEYYSKKLNFCDKYLQCNHKLKFENLEEKNNNNNKLINVGSARYDDEWLELINNIFRLDQNNYKNQNKNFKFFVKKYIICNM